MTNHDVKAVEYFIKEKFDLLSLQEYKEFIHFGLTSQDINNTSVPLSIKDALNEVYFPGLQEVIDMLKKYAEDWADVPMLAKTWTAGFSYPFRKRSDGVCLPFGTTGEAVESDSCFC